MSVRQSLLAILDQGPCYGYQLRAEFDRRTGSTWPLNVGQIYNTLERLERDRLVEKDDVDEHGHVDWRITDAGSAEVRDWLASAVVRSPSRDELAIKITVAVTLPGVDVLQLIDTQRLASAERLDALRAVHPEESEDLARALLHDSTLFAAEAELRWLEHARERVARHPEHTLALALSPERPKRGRPARRTAT